MAQTDDQIWVLAGLGLLALVLGLLVRQLARGKPDPLPDTGPLRLLVRPLRELRPDPNHLYLGNTIARELSVSLKGFERMEPSVGEAAAGLSIDGTVRKTGPRLLINIRLLSGRHPLWTGTYDGAINDLARMEGEIVSNVARVLKLAARNAPAAADAPQANDAG